jgi:transposase
MIAAKGKDGVKDGRNHPDPSTFKSGRECAAWIGLVPRRNSTGGKERLGGISKQGATTN